MAMVKVRRQICQGCGLCVNICPVGAISLHKGLAEIDERKCNSCGLCIAICANQAIIDVVPLATDEFRTAINNLRARTDELLDRLEKLKGVP
jgi:ferredoxin